ncbi:hypothetical protein P108_0073 [Staphylococcus phage P108]|uniref:Uncharacterized protein n=2 Tax=Kayvirus TaxID=1857843 RepID=A0A076YNF0_9CAUD|nr:hypothetical protein P108_0073 [Staphylococcus phage P108]AIK69520.1 hypothetical protein P108_0073 [Staphylococcus phage P108]ARQ96145.1 hypothetical protein qdsa002_188 [Staphylococcus phage qdsa002]WJZ46536.1 hypothetical protein [Staphylococcus phage Baghdad]
MDFNDFINSESDRVGKPKQKKKVENKLPSSTPIEEKEKNVEKNKRKIIIH